MKLKATFNNEVSRLKKANLSLLSSNREAEPTELNLFYKQLLHLKEATDRLSFMISEIHFVLENTPPRRGDKASLQSNK